ncbi:CHAD domain-containing protein [Halomonas sp. 1390]|uniref:CHAD domain-containing protein n=1 Tax=Halomonas sp. B23F22_3 TaxID=3459516 RepID=UPI00373E5CAD
MRQLVLMRHAKAKRGSQKMADHDRPLSKRGRRQAAAMAEAMQYRKDLEGELKLHVSGATRTRETLDEMAKRRPELALSERADVDETLYTFDANALLAWLRRLPDANANVLVIGHNPALLELARWLCPAAPDGLPTGSLLRLALPDTAWRSLERDSAEGMESLTPEQASHALFKRRGPEPPKLDKAGLKRRILELLAHQYRCVRALEPGMVAGVDVEFLHQYRVNLRRSRAIGESVLTTIKVPGLKKRLKRLKRRAQATSDLRDLDVFLESLTESSPPLASRSRQALTRWLQARRKEAHAALCQQLAQPDYAEAMRDWWNLIHSRAFRQALAGVSNKRIASVLIERLVRHDQALAGLTSQSDDGAFHDLRKAVKRIRYLAELAPKRHREFLAGLKHRQRLLGDFQDLCTRQAWIEAFAASARHAPRRRRECDTWQAALEEKKRALREKIMALAPLAGAHGTALKR